MASDLLQLQVLWLLLSSVFSQQEENIALRKSYNQSSFHPNHGNNPSHAANGNTSGYFDNHNCIDTEVKERAPFWQVDLGQVYPVLNITIFGRTDFLHRLVGVSVSVDDRICTRIRSKPRSLNSSLSCATTLYGQLVKLQKEYNDSLTQDDNVLSVCEVQIWVCSRGFYGHSCNRSCGKCSDNSDCDRYTGDCRLLPCQPGYTGSTCHECPDYTFGQNCSSLCGRCQDNVTCQKVNGHCPSGCTAGWTGPRCHQECPQNTFGENCNSTCGQCKDNATCHHVSGNCSLGCAGAWTGDRCDEVAAEEEVNMRMWIALGGGSLLGLIIIIIVVVVLIRSRRKYDLNRTTLPTRLVEDTILAERDCLSDRYSHPPASSSSSYPRAHLEASGHRCTLLAADENRVQMNRLKIYVLDKLQSAGLEREFSQLTTSQVFESTVGASRKNRRKNRFKDILPYDHSRVTLERVDGDDGSDYINASYIKGYQQDKVYIATQGPKQNTADDFWLMVWQEHVTQIVMVTKVVTKPKKTAPFFKYWPSAGEKRRYGQVDVTNIEEFNKAHFIVRTFSVKQDNEYRFVEQFQFTGFTDRETPSAVSFVGFWRFVNSRASHNETSPPIIHCSAGVGLTGVYIALDIVMKQAEFERETNIFDVVNRIRQDRCNMVKNKEYYLFLHRTVLEACVSHYTCLDMETFNSVFDVPVEVFRPNDLIEGQFQTLMVLPDVVVDGYYATAEDVEDTAARKSLRIEVDGRFMSIHAFFLPTLLDVHGILVSPPTNSAETVWRLVENYNVNKIVSLGNDLCRKMQEAVLYWPTKTESRVQARPYTVTLTDKVKMTKCLTGYCLTWQRQQKSAEVQLMHYNDWEGELPCNVGELTNLLITLTKRVHERHQAPLLVVSMEGIARSCLFCVMCHLLGQITVDGQVDVFTAIRHVQSVVPDFVVTAEQYRFCYLMAQQLETSDIYLNTII